MQSSVGLNQSYAQAFLSNYPNINEQFANFYDYWCKNNLIDHSKKVEEGERNHSHSTYDCAKKDTSCDYDYMKDIPYDYSNKKQKIEYSDNTKRKRESSSEFIGTNKCELRKFKDIYFPKTDNERYETSEIMINYMIEIDYFVRKNIDYFKPWVISGKDYDVYKLIDTVISHIKTLKRGDLKYCKYDCKCKYKDLCANIHENVFTLYVSQFNKVLNSVNNFAYAKTPFYASLVIRNMQYLEINIASLITRQDHGLNSLIKFGSK